VTAHTLNDTEIRPTASNADVAGVFGKHDQIAQPRTEDAEAQAIGDAAESPRAQDAAPRTWR